MPRHTAATRAHTESESDSTARHTVRRSQRSRRDRFSALRMRFLLAKSQSQALAVVSPRYLAMPAPIPNQTGPQQSVPATNLHSDLERPEPGLAFAGG